MSSRVGSSWLRLALLVAIGLGGGLVVAALMVLPEALPVLLPRTVIRHPVEWSMVGLLVAYGAVCWLAAYGPGGWRVSATARRALGRVEAFTDLAWRGGLATALGVLILGLLASWAPHYLTWPWARDVDTFATLARSWDAGILPYRDIRGYNFPGHIYLHWILGKSLGWGGTVAYYAVDVGLVVLLGVVLAAWSRRRFGGAVPGLMAYLGFLGFYLGSQYELVAERDWHTALGVALGLLIAEAWPGRWGLVASALAVAVALTIRPHAVLFLPALALAIDEGARRPGEPWARTARALGAWSLAFSLWVAVGFAPLIVAGIADDLARGLRVASYGGPYRGLTSDGAMAVLVRQFRDGTAMAALGSTLLLSCLGPSGLRRTARVWALALVGALAYRPLHPVNQHAYLAHPLVLIGSIALAPAVAWLVATPRLARPLRLLAVALVLYELMPVIPRFCRPDRSLRAVGLLVRGDPPTDPPVGSLQAFPKWVPGTYPWRDYLDVLAYLRRATSPETRVANLLRRLPFPSLNGPTGRLSPFRAESGICWMWFVRMDVDAEFAEALERETDAVVVWVPDEANVEPRMKYAKVAGVVRRRFRREARFGPMEVWRRVPGGPGRIDPDRDRD